jgi:hypothetical protein
MPPREDEISIPDIRRSNRIKKLVWSPFYDVT